jgi:FG-GAP-like repeat
MNIIWNLISVFRRCASLGLVVGATLIFGRPGWAMGLMVEPAASTCTAFQQDSSARKAVPAQAANRLADSQVARGQRNIAWAWLASPTRRYPHPALGSTEHAGSLHVLLQPQAGYADPIVLTLPLHRVFEDRVPRLLDLDGDGTDEILLIESDLFKGSALVVLGIRSERTKGIDKTALVELARGPYTGSTFRWLNPVGVADFDGDGRLDIASVTTPHIGGVLTLYHYRPQKSPKPSGQLDGLVPFASVMDVSNHKMGELEQDLAAIVTLPGHRPAIIVPDMTLTALHAFRWEAPGRWKELADLQPLPARVERIVSTAQGACARLADQSWHRITLAP